MTNHHIGSIFIKSILPPFRASSSAPAKIFAMCCIPSFINIFCCLISCCIWFTHLESNKSICLIPCVMYQWDGSHIQKVKPAYFSKRWFCNHCFYSLHLFCLLKMKGSQFNYVDSPFGSRHFTFSIDTLLFWSRNLSIHIWYLSTLDHSTPSSLIDKWVCVPNHAN